MAPTVCMPTKFAALCARLTKQQLSRVKDIGLECLVDKGEKVEISSKKADTTLFNMYKGRGDTAITLKHLEARIGNGYNWAEFTLEFLINHVELFKKKKRTGLVGNLAFLQIWFFEHVQVANDCFDYALHERPLIGNWDGNKVVKRAQLEGVKKIGFAKVIYHLQGDSAKEVTLSDNVEDVYEESHIMKGSYKAESICDNGKFENILHRIDMLEKETKQQYQSLVRRIEVIEEQTRYLPELVRVMQRVVSFIDRSSGHKSSGVLNEEISEGNIEKEDRPKRDSVKRKLELVKSPTLVEKVKTRRDRQPSKRITSPYEMMKQRKIYEKNVEEVQFDVSRYEQAAILYVKKELARSSDKMLVRIDAMMQVRRQYFKVGVARAEGWIPSTMTCQLYVADVHRLLARRPTPVACGYVDEWTRPGDEFAAAHVHLVVVVFFFFFLGPLGLGSCLLQFVLLHLQLRLHGRVRDGRQRASFRRFSLSSIYLVAGDVRAEIRSAASAKCRKMGGILSFS
ncbi:hypothetical protein GUJ93_ZPchr0009g1467 [Zizania palustris]|uniref:Uncharacterized protein n=1 Tax=Zizania palustris TaxID=103762 RepID=A0A8J5V341_ZIZPA|nr:hypothetical protein GUJ93_ZPchr0009g1467 [Zizania palustris]